MERASYQAIKQHHFVGLSPQSAPALGRRSGLDRFYMAALANTIKEINPSLMGF
jgi:hypothetical protein